MYLSTKLHTSAFIATEHVLPIWQELSQEIEPIDSSTWRIWQTTQVFSEDGFHTRLSSMNGQSHPLKMVTIAAPCYLRTAHEGDRTIFTLISNEKEALESVRSLIENIFAPVEPTGLDQFLQQNPELSVQDVRLYEYDGKLNTKYEALFSYDQPVALSQVLDGRSLSQLLSLSASVDPVFPYLKAQMLYISRVDHQVGFTLQSDLQKEEEEVLIKKLFQLADWAFNITSG